MGGRTKYEAFYIHVRRRHRKCYKLFTDFSPKQLTIRVHYHHKKNTRGCVQRIMRSALNKRFLKFLGGNFLMAYPESHEPYTYDSQDAYYTQPIHYTGYSSAPTAQQVPAPAKQQLKQQPQSNKVMKRTKAESLALVSRLKKWIIAVSVVSFGTLSFLVAGNVVGITSHSSSTSSTSTSSKSNTTVTTPSQSSANSSSGSYFQQGQSQSQSSQGGYGIGNSSSSSQQGAVSSSSTS